MSVLRFIAGATIAFIAYALGYNHGWSEALERLVTIIRRGEQNEEN